MEKPWRSVQRWKIVFAAAFTCFLLSVSGCGPKFPSQEQLRKFEKAGPVTSESSLEGLAAVKNHYGPYHVACGDILEFQLPVILRVISSDLSEWLRPVYGRSDVEPYLVRVSEAGIITLPIVNEIPVAGKTLADVESTVVDAYYPKYIVNRPMVVCEVKKYKNENKRVFTVMGLVNNPDAFPYPPDVQYNLMEALAFAGGLDMVADPRYLKIYRQEADGNIVSATFGVDKKSLADAYNIVIKPGDVVYVDHTLNTRFNKFMSDVFHVTVGADARYSD